MNDTSDPQPEPNRALTIYASEEDLEVVLDGESVKLPYPAAPGEQSTPAEVIFAPDPGKPIGRAGVEALRGEGLDYPIYAPECDEWFSPTVRIGTDRARRDPQIDPGRAREVAVTLTEEAYRMLCGLVQSDTRVNRDEVTGTAWAELRRTFPAAEYVRSPSSRLEIGGIAAQNPRQAENVAREMIADSLAAFGDCDVIVLAPVRDEDDRFCVTVVFHHPELSEHGTRRLA